MRTSNGASSPRTGGGVDLRSMGWGRGCWASRISAQPTALFVWAVGLRRLSPTYGSTARPNLRLRRRTAVLREAARHRLAPGNRPAPSCFPQRRRASIIRFRLLSRFRIPSQHVRDAVAPTITPPRRRRGNRRDRPRRWAARQRSPLPAAADPARLLRTSRSGCRFRPRASGRRRVACDDGKPDRQCNLR